MKPRSSRLALDARCLDVIGSAGGCLVAVSGGADSVALLHGLVRWAGTLQPGPRLEVVHVDHRLRGEGAREDARFVESLCRSFGVPFHLRRTVPPDVRPRGTTLEEFLRQERHRCFQEVLAATGLSVLAVGHTADDLVETLLMHLMRGSGLHGLEFSPVEEFGGATLVRPLGRWSREEILDWLRRHGHDWREDETNLSPEFTRNRIRHRLLPVMEREFNPSVRQALLRSATVLSLAAEHVRPIIRDRLEELTGESGDAGELPLVSFRRLDRFLRMEVAGEWIRRLTDGATRPGFDQIEQILAVADAGRGHVELPGGHAVAATDRSLCLIRAEERKEAGARYGSGDPGALIERILARRHLVTHPGLPLAWLGGRELLLETPEEGRGAAVRVPLLDGSVGTIELEHPLGKAAAGAGLVVRNRRAGDRISGSVKLKEVLNADRVPWFIRNCLLVVADREGRVRQVVGMEWINARLRKRPEGAAVAVSFARGKSGPP